MAPHFWIHNGSEWVDIIGRVNLREPNPLSEKAEEGAMGMAPLVIDDRDLSLEIDPFTPFVATEDTSESDDKIWMAGRIAGRRVVRTNSSSRDPIGRFWVCEVTDANERWHRRVLKAGDANRNEETDNERVTWLLNQMQDWGLLDDDTTYVSSGNPSSDLDEEDFRLRYPDEAMGSSSEAKSKNWWLQIQGDIGDLTVFAWWGRSGNNEYESPLFLTNDLAEIAPRVSQIRDQSSDVWPLRMDHGLRCIPERMVSGVGARHRSGRIYRRDTDTQDLIGVRDMVMAGTEQMTKARAISRAERYLEDFGEEEFRVEARVRLPASKVTQLRAGMRVPVAMTHWPFGLDEWTWWRVVTCSPNPAPAGPWYDLEIELVSTGEAASGPPGPSYEGDAIAALIGWTSNPNPAITEQSFTYTGDNAGGGYAGLPTIGPLSPVEGDAPDFGITATEAMVVRISAEIWCLGVVTVAESATLNVRVNGEIIGSVTHTPDPRTQYLVDVYDVTLAPGDVVTMDTTVENDGFLGAFGDQGVADKNSSMLIVGRGTHTNVPDGSFYGTTWVGP